MLKFFYRLKRGRGMVLFVVIAIMTLLIAMATTAYLTAYSSYKTVVSNYDFSQLYLSTTSLSDMAIGALTQSSSRPSVTGTTESSPSSAVKLNDYAALKQAVIDMKTAAMNKVKSGSTEEAAVASSTPLVGYSHNIVKGASGTYTSDMMLKASNADPIEPGVVDGVKVSIKLRKMIKELDVSSNPTGRYEYYFTVDTTGFYRNNYVSVQDTIYNISGSVASKGPVINSFFKGTGGSGKTKGERVVAIGTQEISDNAYFENTFTLFCEFSGGNNEFLGGITTAGSVYFTGQCKTKIPKPGEVWKQDGNSTTEANARHDWFINGNLGLMSDNSGTLDLNGNNLYVNGDLIIGNQSKGIKANNIYVTGNVYFLNTSGKLELTDDKGATSGTIGNLYIGGDIICDKPENITLDKSDGTWNAAYGSSWNTLLDEWNDVKARTLSAAKEIGETSVTVRDYYSSNDSDYTNGVIHDNINNTTIPKEHIFIGGTSRNFTKDGKSLQWTSTTKKDIKDKTVSVSTLVEDSAGTGYEYKTSDMTISKIFDLDSGVTSTQEWSAYTAKDATMSNSLTIDIDSAASAINSISYGDEDPPKKTVEFTCYDGTTAKVTVDNNGNTSDKNVWSYEYEFTSTGTTKTTATVKLKKDTRPEVFIPYNSDGYLLDYHSASSISLQGSNKSAKDWSIVKFGTAKDQTMPVVLKANGKDKSGNQEDTNHNNAFSWTGINPSTGKANNSNDGAFVSLVNGDGTGSAEGNVIFELGNIDSSGKYVKYTGSGTDAVTYRIGEATMLGTQKQIETVCGTSLSAGNIGSTTEMKKLLKDDSNCDPKDDCENRIMIVSNKNTSTINEVDDLAKTKAGVIYDCKGAGKAPTICGYIYAPNALYVNPQLNSNVALFGGLIVSEYITGLSTYYYGEPNPKIIASLLSGLDKKDDGGSTSSAEGDWYITGLGRNYLG